MPRSSSRSRHRSRRSKSKRSSGRRVSKAIFYPEEDIDASIPEMYAMRLSPKTQRSSTRSRRRSICSNQSTQTTRGKSSFCEVEIWLTINVKLPEYTTLFLKNGWDDLEIIINKMDSRHLKEIGISKSGHRAKIAYYIDKERQKQLK